MGPRAAQLLEDSVKSAAWAACDFDEPWKKHIEHWRNTGIFRRKP